LHFSLRSTSLNRNFTVHFVALVLLNSIFPALISALSDFPALFASLTRENPHEEIEGKIELRKTPRKVDNAIKLVEIAIISLLFIKSLLLIIYKNCCNE